MKVTWTLSGKEIGNRDAVTIAWSVVTPDGWGDPAVVVDWETCMAHEDCRVLTVAPDETDSLEYVHVGDAVQVKVVRQLGEGE